VDTGAGKRKESRSLNGMIKMHEKSNKKEIDKLVIKSFRSVHKWVSNDVINRCEDGLVEMNPQISLAGIEKFFYYIKKIFTNRYVRSNTFFRLLYQGLQSIFSKKIKESLFVTCMPPYLFDILGFYKTKGVKIAFIIDAWESSIEYIAENIDLADIILIAYQDSINFLEKQIPQKSMEKVHLFPNFITSNAYPAKSAKKIYDMIQVGRKNNILHKWAKEYSRKKGYSYLFQKRNQRGMYYLENRNWEAENYQLSYQSLIKVLSQSKIAMVSPPNRADSKRTGRISPLTHRYLEAAMCRAVTVGFTPNSGEYARHFPKDFTIVPKDYGEFEKICDRLIENADLRSETAHKNRNYVLENHSVEVRYKQLQEILINHKKK